MSRLGASSGVVSGIVAALKSCRHSRDLVRGRKIHAAVTAAGLGSDIQVSSSLIAMYSKCGSMADAREIFLAMPLHSLASWSALILGYAVNGDGGLALEIFDRLEREGGFPDLNSHVYVAALVAVASLASREEEAEAEEEIRERNDDRDRKKLPWLDKTMDIHYKAEKKTKIEACPIFLSSALIDSYSKCGSLIDARMVFDQMPHRDVVAWTALIQGYVDNDQCELALELFDAMIDSNIVPNSRTFVAGFMAVSGLADGADQAKLLLDRANDLYSMAVTMQPHSNIFVANTAVDMFARCGNIDRARAVFDSIQDKSIVSWNALIRGYAAGDDQSSAIALELFLRMHDDHETVAPNHRTFTAALEACANLGSIHGARSIHARVSRRGLLLSDPILTNCLLNCYARCGSMENAEIILDAMNKESRSFVTWSSIVGGYARAGDARAAIQAMEAMQDDGFRPNSTTFVSILHACSHARAVDPGMELFETMVTRFGIQREMEHYHCVIDLLGRANRIEEAVEVANKMPFQANATTWRTVLAACRKWERVEIGEVVFEKLIAMDEQQPSIYLLMAGIYACKGMWDERDQVLKAMRSYNRNSIE